MSLPTRSPTITDSPLSRWDPRGKVVILTLLAIGAGLTWSLPTAIVAMGVAVILLIVGRVPFAATFGTIQLLLLGLLPLAVAMPFLGTSTWQESFTVVVRGLAVGLILFTIVATTRPDRLFAALGRLGVPRLLVSLLAFAYRYSMLLTAEVKRVRVAAAARGFRFRPSLRTGVVTARMAGQTIARSQIRAESVAQAMAARGFRGRGPDGEGDPPRHA
jgi:energy-coupling factor transporter transmembrane protein EcfT